MVVRVPACSGIRPEQAEMLGAGATVLGKNRSHLLTNLKETEDDHTRLRVLSSVFDQRSAPLKALRGLPVTAEGRLPVSCL